MYNSKRIVISSATITSGGLGTYLKNLAQRLKDAGWIVTIIVTDSKSSFFDASFNAFECHDLTVLPLSGKKIWAAVNLIHKIAPDILLLNHCSLLQYALPLLEQSVKPIVVLHSDDVRYYSTASFFADRIFRWIAPTAGVRDMFISFLQSRNSNRIRLIPHGVDNAIYHSAVKEQHKDKCVTFVGYLDRNKGVDLLIPIFEAVSARFPDAAFAVVGIGPMRDELERQAKTGVLRDKCIFTGLISPPEVADILRRSAVFLLPTRIEGFGLAIAEAMMCGAVPVVTRISGVTDQLMDNDKSGFLVDQDDVAGFVKAINTILADDSLRQGLSETATREAERRFSLNRMIGDYEQMFQEEDDRPRRMQRSKTGWLTELVPEVVRSGSFKDSLKKGKYLFR